MITLITDSRPIMPKKIKTTFRIIANMAMGERSFSARLAARQSHIRTSTATRAGADKPVVSPIRKHRTTEIKVTQSVNSAIYSSCIWIELIIAQIWTAHICHPRLSPGLRSCGEREERLSDRKNSVPFLRMRGKRLHSGSRSQTGILRLP